MARKDEKLTHETGRRVEDIPVAHDGYANCLRDQGGGELFPITARPPSPDVCRGHTGWAEMRFKMRSTSDNDDSLNSAAAASPPPASQKTLVS